MAHLSRMCEFTAYRTRRAWRTFNHGARRWRKGLPGNCLLCDQGVRVAGLCDLCESLVWQSAKSAAVRCRYCWLAVEPNDDCTSCAQQPPAVDRTVAVFDYVAPLDVLIHRFKVERRLTAAPVLGALLAQATLAALQHHVTELVLLPVPARASSLRARGFSPAAELARVLARDLQRPCRYDVVRRLYDGRKQALLGRRERQDSVTTLYQALKPINGQTIAVVDDVMTTGSTLDAIARELKRAGAQRVYGLVLARTPFTRHQAH